MGLSGRKIKQRIPHDPRNLSWADDASRFGSAYLSKLGFDHTDKNATLGLSGNGLSQHIKVDHKLDLLGIGAQHTQDPNGIAWKQNKDFENLLKRLNAAADGTEAEPRTDDVVVDGFERAKGDAEDEAVEQEGKSEKKSKKRKRNKNVNDEDGETRKKKDKKVKVKERVDNRPPASPSQPSSVEKTPSAPTIHQHRGRAHRARFIAAKSLAASSSAAVSEILGIASSSTTSASTSGLTTPQIEERDDSHKLNVSSTSIGDYFKAKMKLISAGKLMVKATDDIDSEERLRCNTGSKDDAFEKEETRDGEERIGLGMKFGLGMMARMELEKVSEVKEAEVLVGNKMDKRKDKVDKEKKNKKSKKVDVEEDEQSRRDKAGKKRQKKSDDVVESKRRKRKSPEQ